MIEFGNFDNEIIVKPLLFEQVKYVINNSYSFLE